MQKLKIEFYNSSLDTVCYFLQQAFEALPVNRKHLKNKSIAIQLFKKLKKKQLERVGKQDGVFKINIEVYEAIVMDELLRESIYKDTTIYQQAQIRTVIDNINQLTA